MTEFFIIIQSNLSLNFTLVIQWKFWQHKRNYNFINYFFIWNFWIVFVFGEVQKVFSVEMFTKLSKIQIEANVKFICTFVENLKHVIASLYFCFCFEMFIKIFSSSFLFCSVLFMLIKPKWRSTGGIIY